MSFTSGRVAYCRLMVEGDAPTAVDEVTLATLGENAFRETEIGAPDEIEMGWTTGEHIFDTQFSYEKNGFGNMLLFALRIDTHRVPSEVKRAYKLINEQAAAAENPSGFANKNQRREAKELADRQVHEDLAAGKYRQSKAVQLLWDFKNRVLYSSNTSAKVLESVAAQMRASFNVQCTLITSGALAGETVRTWGRERDYEDLRPSAFTSAPDAALHDDEQEDRFRGDMAIPDVPWTHSSTDMKDFLGNEFLVWLWWVTEQQDGMIEAETESGKVDIALAIDKTVEMDCAWGITGKQSLRSTGPTRLAEAGEALVGGKWPRKFGLLLSDGEANWELTLQGDMWQVSGAAMPEITEAESPRDVTEGRLLLTRRLSDTLDAAYRAFLKQRTSGAWQSRKQQIREWIKARRKGAKSTAVMAG